MKGSGKQVQRESLCCKIHPNSDPWDELSWLESGANNTKFVGPIPIWAIHLKSWTWWSCGSRPTQNILAICESVEGTQKGQKCWQLCLLLPTWEIKSYWGNGCFCGPKSTIMTSRRPHTNLQGLPALPPGKSLARACPVQQARATARKIPAHDASYRDYNLSIGMCCVSSDNALMPW